MNEKSLDEYYFHQLNPLVAESMTADQRDEVRRLLRRVVKVPSQKLIEFKFTFWFIKRFYVVFYWGLDQRSRERNADTPMLDGSLSHVIRRTLQLVMLLITLGLLGVLAYEAKSSLGIDIMRERHLQDIFAD